jgi:DNA-binding NtrC family response regulator
LLLDEVGDMSPLTQSKMLRVLQEKRFERLGGAETIATDVRVLAATNTHLEAAVAKGRFRQDLFYRLSVFTIALPLLRERGEDLSLLVTHYLRRYSRDLGKEVTAIRPEAMELLRRHSWPGNVRELQSVLLTAILHTTGPLLLPEFLPPLTTAARGESGRAPSEVATDLERFIDARLAEGADNLYAEAVRRLEQALLPRVLRHTNGNQLRASELLGISRTTFRAKLRALGMTPARTHLSDPDPTE